MFTFCHRSDSKSDGRSAHIQGSALGRHAPVYMLVCNSEPPRPRMVAHLAAEPSRPASALAAALGGTAMWLWAKGISVLALSGNFGICHDAPKK